MNLRNVLSAYSKLRQLTDDESALLETLRGLNDTERESLVVALQPEKTATKRVSNASKKSGKSASKSARASAMAAALNKSLAQQRKVATKDAVDENDKLDIFDAITERRMQLCTTCGGYEEHMDHHRPSPNYHPFVPSTTAPPSPVPSAANGEAGNSEASLETGKGAVGIAVGGSSE